MYCMFVVDEYPTHIDPQHSSGISDGLFVVICE